MSDQFKVVCGKCHSDPEIVTDSDGEAAVCGSCGQRDSLKDAQRIASEHFLKQAIPDLNKGFGSAVRGSKVMKFEAKSQPRRSYRWHAVPL